MGSNLSGVRLVGGRLGISTVFLLIQERLRGFPHLRPSGMSKNIAAFYSIIDMMVFLSLVLYFLKNIDQL